MATTITKADGSAEYFKVEKLRRSLRRAGANPAEVNEIVAQVETTLYDGMETQEIYRHAFALLRKSETAVAARYSLRRALFGLGPTGFPFEIFLARLFQTDGYTTKTGIIIEGKCAPHEIDLAAYKSDHSFVGEAKFHARPGIKSDLQVAMYSYARLLDLREAKICQEDICGIKEFWLVTNTKFTTTAEKYAACVGVNLLSWDYPRNNNLHDRIQRAGIYPVTVLQSISTAQIETLIARGVILCQDILQNQHILRHLHLSAKKQESLLGEVRAVCHTGNIVR
ncbi:MAG: ATP cone domain-containing protein [Patescibacteria group bacterium]